MAITDFVIIEGIKLTTEPLVSPLSIKVETTFRYTSAKET